MCFIGRDQTNQYQAYKQICKQENMRCSKNTYIRMLLNTEHNRSNFILEAPTIPQLWFVPVWQVQLDSHPLESNPQIHHVNHLKSSLKNANGWVSKNVKNGRVGISSSIFTRQKYKVCQATGCSKGSMMNELITLTSSQNLSDLSNLHYLQPWRYGKTCWDTFKSTIRSKESHCAPRDVIWHILKSKDPLNYSPPWHCWRHCYVNLWRCQFIPNLESIWIIDFSCAHDQAIF